MSDTQEQMVVAQPPLAIAPKRVHRWWAVPLIGVSFVVLAGIIVGTFLTSSRIGVERPYAIVPSEAEGVQPRIELLDVDRYTADGRILFVTIRWPQMSVLSWLMFRNGDELTPTTREQKYGTRTPSQQQVRGQRQMRTAQQTAEYAALSKLGYPIELVQGAVVVDSIMCLEPSEDGRTCDVRAPSGAVLEPDDEIVGIDGETVAVPDDIGPLLADKEPGDTVEVTYKRAGVDGEQTGEVELIESPTGDGRTLIGFNLFDTTTVGVTPFPIAISADGIGGPSAGLAFTLTLIDELTPGELTGGKKVAVTGEISIDGTVGAIGGVVQKAQAVQQAGADYFLVPATQSDEELAEARALVGDDVEIIPVATLDEAIAALVELGGNGDEIGTPGADFESADDANGDASDAAGGAGD